MFKSKKVIALTLTALMAVPYNFSTPAMASVADIDGWTFSLAGGVNIDAELDSTYHQLGKTSLKIINHTSKTSNVYMLMSQNINVEAGKTYYVGGKCKSDYADGVNFIIGNDWSVRYNMTNYGTTYDWTNFEVLYKAKETATIPFQFIVEGKCQIWLDDFKFENIETGDNILANPSFEGQATSEEDTKVDLSGIDSFDDIYSAILNSSTFDAADMEKVSGGFKYIPVYKASNITIDGSSDEWANYQAISMPTLSTQYQIYMNDGLPYDVDAKCKFAYDDDYLYMNVEVLDNTQFGVGGDSLYWVGDSLQFTVSSFDENYGTEYGASINPDNNEIELHNLTATGQIKTQGYGKVEQTDDGVKTTYEIAYPWSMKFNTRPDQIKFDILDNDNDGTGRRYCAELAPGISEGKTNVKFPVLEMLDESASWYGWIQPANGTTVNTNTNVDLDCFVVNNGDKDIQLTASDSVDNQEEIIQVPAHKGIHKRLTKSFENEEKVKVYYNLNDGSATKSTFTELDVKKPEATKAEAEAAIVNLQKQVKELSTLIKKCNKKNISTYYEDTHVSILDKFCGYIQEDIDYGDLSRVNYTIRTTTEIYENDKETLNAYLKGTKTPREVPEYVTSKITNDNTTFYGQVAGTDGEVTEEPVILIGYGHNLSNETIGDMISYGGNATQFEVGPSQDLSALPGWNFEYGLSQDVSWKIDTENKAEGTQSLYVEYNSAVGQNQYLALKQSVAVTPGHKYTFSGKAKLNNVERLIIFANNWTGGGRINGTEDWTDFSYEFTATTTMAIPMFVCDAPGKIWLDNLSLVDQDAPDKELMTNGGFEASDGTMPVFSENNVIPTLEKLEICEENNISVSFLISPHYFFDEIVKQYNIPYNGFGFLNYDVNAPIAKQILTEHISHLLPLIKDYDCVANITLSNEPYFRVEECNGVYDDAWHQYLESIYGTIDNLNATYGGTTYASFAEVPLTQNTSIKAANYDYYQFNTETFASWHKFLADLCHQYAPEIPVQSKIMGYTYQDGTMSTMNAGINYELYADFLDLNGCDYGGNMGKSYQKPLGKEMFYDYMQSIIDKPVVDSENHNTGDGDDTYTPERAWHMAQDVYNGVIHGRNYCVSWILMRSNSNSEIADNILYRPDALVDCADVTWDIQRLTHEITALQKEPHKIGILYTNENVINLDSGMSSDYKAYRSCLWEGKIPRFILESQLDKMDNYPILVVPGVKYLKAETLTKIKSYIDNGGYVIISGGDNLLDKTERNGDQDAATRDYVYSHSVVLDNSEESTLRLAIATAMDKVGINHPLLVDATTGERVENVEYETTVYNGKLIFNISNFDRKYGNTQTLKLMYNGKQVTDITDLRSNEKIGDTISIDAYHISTYQAEIPAE